jgi:hypothetical protein
MKHLYLTGIAALTLFASTHEAFSQSITHSIAEIQGELFSSPLLGQSVTTTGIISANNVASATSGVIGYFLQDGTGPWNGVFVYDNTQAPNIGDEVIIQGEVQEYFDVTELGNISYFEVVSTGNDVPDPSIVTTGELSSSEAYEGCFVQIINAVCTSPDADFGEALFDDGSGEIKTNDYMYIPESGWVQGETYSLTGCMHYTFEEYKLEVRSEADVIIGQVNGIQANPGGLLKTYPNPTSGLIRLGTDELGRLTIVDMAGRFVMQINTLEPFPSIDLGHLETGVYLISFETPSATYQSKLQKL